MTDPAFELGARPIGYRLLGPRFAYLLHLRPAEWPIMAAHTAVGFLIAVQLRDVVGHPALTRALLGLVLWVVCLNGGTLAVNSAFDKDEGDIAYLRRPPAPPPHLFAFGLLLMVVGQVVAVLALPGMFSVVYAICFAMSILYSVPPFRLKAVAGADWVINMVGFGSLTPLAGWALSGVPLEPWGAWAIGAFCPLFAALYPLTQLYQMDEDRRRGDRTLALALGLERSLDIAIGAVLLAFVCFGLAGVAAGWSQSRFFFWRWSAVFVALTAWLIVLLPWRRDVRHYSPARHQRGMHLALGAWAVTDIVVLFVWGT